MMKKLFRILIFSLSMVLISFNMTAAQVDYKISGEVHYSGPNNIIICLYDQNTWPAWKKELPSANFLIRTKADKSGKTKFSFNKIPKNDYVILIFIDSNDNGKLDCDTWGFVQELIDFYKPVKEHSNWNDQKFTLDKDLAGLVFQFR